MTHSHEIEDTQSGWLRQAKAELMLRDPADAVNDAEALVRFATNRLDAIVSESFKRTD